MRCGERGWRGDLGNGVGESPVIYGNGEGVLKAATHVPGTVIGLFMQDGWPRRECWKKGARLLSRTER